MTGLDLGCGFDLNQHYPSRELNVGLDLNIDLADERFLEVFEHLIIGDAQNIPIRSNCLSYIRARAILEHLDQPIKCLREIKRTLKFRGYTVITIPIITSHLRHYLIIFFTQFPFSVWDIVTNLRRIKPFLKIEGWYHKRNVKPCHVGIVFKNMELKTVYYRHKWFYGAWGKLLRKLTNGFEMKDIQGFHEVIAWN